MVQDIGSKDIRKLSRDDLLYLLVGALGVTFLLVALSDGAGYYRWRFALYLVLAALSAAALVLLLARRRVRFGGAFSAAMAVFRALFALAALSLIWGRSFYGGIQGLLLLGSFAAAFFLGYQLLGQRDALWVFLSLMTAAAVSLCVYGLMQYFFFFEDLIGFMRVHGLDYELTDRVFSRFINPNVFAAFLNLAIAVAVALVLIEGRRALAWVWGAALGLELVCLYLTQSRAGWISFLLMAVLLAVAIPNRSWKGRWTILAAVLVVAAVGCLLCSLYSPLEAGAGSGGTTTAGSGYSGLDVAAAAGSMRGRVGIWRGGLDMFTHNLAGGVGMGSFGLGMQEYQYRAYYSTHAHNYLLEAGAEMGMIGLLLTAVLSLMVLYRIRGVYRLKLEGDLRIVAVAVWAMAAGFFLHNLTDISWFTPITGTAFWVCAGALFAVTEGGALPAWEDATPEPSQPSDPDAYGAGRDPGRRRGPALAAAAAAAIAAVVLLGYALALFFMSSTCKERADEAGTMGETAAAVADYERALDFYEADPGLHQQLGYLLQTQYVMEREERESAGYAESSLANLDRSIQLEPDNAYGHLWRGTLLLNLGEREEGRLSLREAQRLYPNNPAAFHFEGESYLDEGDYDRALEAYAGAVALLPYYADPSIVPFIDRPEFDWVLRSVQRTADIYVRQGRHGEALATVDAALEELPDNARLRFWKAVVLEQMGDLEGALEELGRVAELVPDAAGVHLKMGLIYERMGASGKAEEEFRRELEIDPESAEAARELESLSGGE